MGLRIIYGRGGSGKTTTVFNEIRERIGAGQKVIILVPEQYTFRTEQNVLQKLPVSSLLQVSILSFNSLVRKVLNTVGGATHNLISDTGKVMLLSKAMNDVRDELTLFKNVSRKPGFVEIAKDLVEEFRRFDVDMEKFAVAAEGVKDEELASKLRDISNIYNRYEEELHKEYVDSTDEITFSLGKFRDAGFLRDAVVYIDEFNDFSVMQLNIIEVLLRHAGQVNITLTLDNMNFHDSEVFAVTRETERRILERAQAMGAELEKPLVLDGGVPARFRYSREIAHLEREFFRYPNRTYTDEVGSITIYKAHNTFSEVERVAKDIAKRIREEEDLRYRDIAILCRNIDDYEGIVSSVFREYDIPLFLDKRRSISGNPLSVYILSLFETMISGYGYDAVFRLLKTELTPFSRDDVDVFENYVLAHGMKGWHYGEVWAYDYPNISDPELNKRFVNRVNAVRQGFIDLYGPLKERMSEAKDVRELTTILYLHMEEAGILAKAEAFMAKIGNVGIRKEYQEVLKGIIEILDDMVAVLGKDTLELPVYSEILRASISNHEIGLIPLTLDQAILGDVARVKSGGIKGLYILGANDGVFPRTVKDEGIFTDRDRAYLKEKGIEISLDSKTRSVFEQFLVYTAFSIASDYLFISYPAADMEGKSLRPSMIIPRIKRIFPKLREEASPSPLEAMSPGLEEVTRVMPTFNTLVHEMRRNYQGDDVKPLWGEVYDWYKSSEEFKSRLKISERGLEYTNMAPTLSRQTVKKLYGDQLYLSVSKLERFAQCPFAYFIQYGLKAKDRVLHEITAPDVGTLMHKVIDEFTEDMKGIEGGMTTVDREYIRKNIDRLVDEAIDKTNTIYKSSARYKNMGEKVKKILNRSVETITNQIAKGDFVPMFNELGFGEGGTLPPLTIHLDDLDEDVLLMGRIDRIDVLELDGKSYIRIIDYKSSGKDISLLDIFYGLQLQLLVYLDVVLKNAGTLLKNQAVPGAVLYFRMDDPMIKGNKSVTDEEVEQQVLESLQMKGLLLKDARVIRSMDKDMGDYSLVVPAKILGNGDVVSKSNRKDKNMSMILTEDEFTELRAYVNESIKRILRELINGNITVIPSKNKEKIPCTYCTYAAVCQFDSKIPGNDYNKVKPIPIEELWEKIKEGGGDDE